MGTATFETPTLADVLKRAASVAPVRGDAFSTSAGIYLEFTQGQCMVRATDTAIFYTEMVRCEVDSEFKWRIPSAVIANTVGKLPMRSGAQVTLNDAEEPSRIVMRSGRTVVKIGRLDARDYPDWDIHDTSELAMVSEFGSKIKQVMWAAATDDPACNGVVIYPDSVGATNRYRMAQVLVDTGVPGDEPFFMVPGRLLSKVVPDNGDVLIGREENAFIVQPNEQTQIKTVLVDTGLFDIRKVLSRELDYQVSTFNKEEMVACMNRAIDFTGGNRQARMAVYLGRGEIALHMDNSDLGMFGDVVEAGGDAADHQRICIQFNPINLRDALASFPSAVVTIRYLMPNPGDTKMKPVMFTNEQGYNSMLAPLGDPPKKEEE